MLKKAQEDCFRYRTITESTYRIRAEKYKSRIAKINHTIPVLELTAFGKKSESKKEEKKGILEIKDGNN